MSKISITDVAKRAGFSTATASYALNGSGRVADSTRQKVLSAAEELGFIPDHSAIRLRTGKSNLIGMIINDINNPYFAELFSAFEEATWNAGYLTVLATSQDDPERQKRLVESMVSQGVAGVVVSPVHGSSIEDLAPFKKRTIPYLVCVRDIGDNTAGLVVADDLKAGFLAAQHALQNGHRRMAFIGGFEHTATWQGRYAGMQKAIAKSGLNVSLDHFPGMEGPDYGSRVVKQLMTKKRSPTVIIGLNDDTAMGTYLAALELGIEIGRDLSVIGFDNIPQTSTLSPPMTTVELFPRKMGFKCAEQLTRMLNDGRKNPRKVKLTPVLIKRNSVARL